MQCSLAVNDITSKFKGPIQSGLMSLHQDLYFKQFLVHVSKLHLKFSLFLSYLLNHFNNL